MNKKTITKMSKGAASFYVVAFSTLILLIVVASFTALVIAQITRSSNDDLAQSAYDSALAGVEDAKLAYYSYQNCIAQGASASDPSSDSSSSVSCGEIIRWVEEESDDCDIVARILGRTITRDDNNNMVGVSIDETKGASNGTARNNMQQWYTCAKMQTSLKDYRTTLSSSNPMKVINVKIDNMNDPNINLNSIKKMKVSWGSDLNSSDVSMTNFVGNEVKYQKIGGSTRAANPPTIAVGFVQAESSFTMEDLQTVKNGHSDRGFVYLTPVTLQPKSTDGKDNNYRGTTFKNGMSLVPRSDVVKSNTEVRQNLPFGVSCPNVGEGDFACSAMIEFPEVVDGNSDGISVRSDENFMIAMFLPYGASTDMMLEFFCDDGVKCGVEKRVCSEEEEDCIEGGGTYGDGISRKNTNQINLKGIQVGIDSTGRANDLFRRVDTRLESSGSSAISLMGPLELFGFKDEDDTESVGLEKNYAVTCEYNFSPTTCN